MPRSEIYIGSLAYSKELLLIELELLNKLQRLSLREGTSVSETINKLLNKQLGDEDNE